MEQQGEIILYQPDEAVKLEVRLEDETVWLTQAQIAELFGTGRQTITKHLKNIFSSSELDENSVCSILELTASDGKVYKTKVYNLDAILSVGYRVNSKNATLFRRWANKVLKDYLLKGYSINQRINQLENKIDSKLATHDRQLEELTNKVDFFVRTSLPPLEGVFFDGQIFDAYKFVIDLIKSAKQSIILIDNYVDESVLLMLSKRRSGVSATIYTYKINAQLQLDLEKHNDQYPPIDIRTNKNSHDRFLIIDQTEVYHIGASLKDLGKKLFAFSKMSVNATILIKML
uniref:RhuM family protein n=1 Tax=Bacteroides fragilis TaxID=817 RepID=UPI0035656BB7